MHGFRAAAIAWSAFERTQYPMPLKSVSFRTTLLGTTGDLLQTVGIDCARTARFLVNTISSLAIYTEEGQPFSPEVYLCNSISEMVKRAGAGAFIVLGTSADIESAGSLALKYGAPLCAARWNIFVERNDEGACRFGVFSETGDPAALTAEETLLNEYDPAFPLVMIAQNGVNRVRLTPAGKPAVEFRFNADIDVPELVDRGHISEIAMLISASKDAGHHSFSAYLLRVLKSAIERSHGTLIAVIGAGATGLPEILTDAVSIVPPLDLYQLYRTHMDEGRTSESVNALQGATELVAGFIASDGITVFDTDGRLRAYRAFIRPPEAPEPSVSGGARTRAFNALREAVAESQLNAAFFRSQDGRTEIVQSVEQG